MKVAKKAFMILGFIIGIVGSYLLYISVMETRALGGTSSGCPAVIGIANKQNPEEAISKFLPSCKPIPLAGLQLQKGKWGFVLQLIGSVLLLIEALLEQIVSLLKRILKNI